MNTRLIFYCTHTQYGKFEKIIFETVLSGLPFESISDANQWLSDDKISDIYNNFDLDLVFDWIIIGYEQTTENVSDIQIKEIIEGKLTFKKKEKKVKKSSKKINIKSDLIVEVPKVKEKKKDYPSVWIDPYGKMYNVEFAMHNEFAADWLEENDKKVYDELTISTGKYYYAELEDRGWVRILGWTRVPTFVLPNKIGPKLKSAIREYCLSQKLDYKDFPEILKS